jgi:glucose-6-phosphate 1-epimerase
MAGPVETPLAGGLPGVTLVSSTGCTAQVYLHGGHVASWRTSEGDDIIFLSSEVRPAARTIESASQKHSLAGVGP